MKEMTTSNLRKCLSLVIAIFLYYEIYEGGHVIVALFSDEHTIY